MNNWIFLNFFLNSGFQMFHDFLRKYTSNLHFSSIQKARDVQFVFHGFACFLFQLRGRLIPEHDLLAVFYVGCIFGVLRIRIRQFVLAFLQHVNRYSFMFRSNMTFFRNQNKCLSCLSRNKKKKRIIFLVDHNIKYISYSKIASWHVDHISK